jgi:tetratricopeptide (TPR) repeat protein
MEYNAGNARFRSGDLGLAILHYKRALRLDPRHAEARANLSAARRKRLDQAEAAGPTIMERLAFWHRLLSAKEKFSLGLGFWILGWLPLLVQLFRPLPWLRTLAAFCLLPAAGLVLSLAVQLWSESRHPEAVVQAPEVFLRLGGAERYDPAVKEPLHPGTELQILEARGAWFRVRLNKDISGWLPQDSLALVPPPGPAPK